MSLDLDALRAANLARWNAMRIDAARIVEADRMARRLIAGWTRYVMVSAIARVPPGVIACLHEKGAGGDFNAHLLTGDSLRLPTVHGLAGRLPPPAQAPYTFEAAAIDALSTLDRLEGWSDWSIAGALTALEACAGFAFARRGAPAPVIWAGTDQYVAGDFLEGEFDPAQVAPDLGCAVLLARLVAAGADVGLSGIVVGEAEHPTSIITTAKATAPQKREHTVPELRAALNRLLALDPPLADDHDGRAILRAVRKLQDAHGALDDGKIDPLLWRMIEAAIAKLDAAPEDKGP